LYKPHGIAALPALGLTGVAVWAVVRWARRAPQVESLMDALPARRGRVIAWALVVLVFAPFVALAQVGEDAVPLARQAVALALYGVFVGLAWANLRNGRAPRLTIMPRSTRWWVARASVGVAVALAAVAVPFTEAVSILVVWGGGAVVALTMLGVAIVGAMRSRPAPPAPAAPRRDPLAQS
uniref:hypothetical protein n=1 Tax=Demequina sp. TaxID=2050685 RepID=UPI0025BCED9B